MSHKKDWYGRAFVLGFFPLIPWILFLILFPNFHQDFILAGGVTWAYFIIIYSFENLQIFTEDKEHRTESFWYYALYPLLSFAIYFSFVIESLITIKNKNDYFYLSYVLIISSMILTYYVFKNHYKLFDPNYIKNKIKDDKSKQEKKLDEEKTGGIKT